MPSNLPGSRARGTTGIGMANNRLRGMVWQLSIPIILVEATETLDHLID